MATTTTMMATRRKATQGFAKRRKAARRSATQRDATRRDATRRPTRRPTRRDATRRSATQSDATRRDARTNATTHATTHATTAFLLRSSGACLLCGLRGLHRLRGVGSWAARGHSSAHASPAGWRTARRRPWHRCSERCARALVRLAAARYCRCACQQYLMLCCPIPRSRLPFGGIEVLQRARVNTPRWCGAHALDQPFWRAAASYSCVRRPTFHMADSLIT